MNQHNTINRPGKTCRKIPFGHLQVMYALSQIRKSKKIHRRQERRYYYCHECNAYHLTKKT